MEKRSFLQYAEQELGKVPKFLIYAVLEWIIILILFVEGFLAFLANELAKLFGLDIPCLLCTRIDHALVSGNEHFYYNDSICDNHKKTVSCLAFCHAHKKLSDMRNLCESCLLSFATERESDGHTYKSLLGILHKDIDLFLDEEQQVHLSLPTGGIKGEEVIEKSNDHRCACCGNPLKVKSSDSKWKGSSFSSLDTAPSPRAPANQNSDCSRAKRKGSSFSSLDTAPSPRAPANQNSDCSRAKRKGSSFSSLDTAPSPRAPANQNSDCSRGTTMEKPPLRFVKADSAPSLMDAYEDKTPNVVLGNKFFGISLLDSAANSPRMTRIPRKSLLEKMEFASESAEGQVLNNEAENDILQQLKGQVRMDRKSLMALYMELDEEKNASAEAANNAMAMITRLQTEKAAVQMEALQYQRVMEEQMEYDQEALQELYNLLVKREEDIERLEAELDAYRQQHGLLKDFGFPKQREKTDEKSNILKMLSYSFNGRIECGSPAFRLNNLDMFDNIGGKEAIDKKKVPPGVRQLGRLKHLERSDSYNAYAKTDALAADVQLPKHVEVPDLTDEESGLSAR